MLVAKRHEEETESQAFACVVTGRRYRPAILAYDLPFPVRQPRGDLRTAVDQPIVDDGHRNRAPDVGIAEFSGQRDPNVIRIAVQKTIVCNREYLFAGEVDAAPFISAHYHEKTARFFVRRTAVIAYIVVLYVGDFPAGIGREPVFALLADDDARRFAIEYVDLVPVVVFVCRCIVCFDGRVARGGRGTMQHVAVPIDQQRRLRIRGHECLESPVVHRSRHGSVNRAGYDVAKRIDHSAVVARLLSRITEITGFGA